MHLIKCIVTNPHEDSFTRFVLQDLNFQPSSQCFGVFFIPTLYHQTLAVDQMEQDDDPVIQHVTSTHGKCKQHQKNPSEDPRRTEEYPRGTHPSWHEITDILDTNPTLIINTPSNLQFSQSANGQIHHIVIQLLCKWTHNYTCTINPIFLTEPENYPQPETCQDILNFWTINQIQDTFHAPAFLPHKSHWKGLPKGSKQLSFGERFKSFFPPLETEFQQVLTKPEHDILSLQYGLQAVFDLLECLPDKAAGINTQPWKYDPDKGGPSFIVNAKAYKIHGVGPPKKKTNIPRPGAIATHTRIEALLLADNLNLNFNDAIKHIKGNNQQAQKQAKHSANANQTQEIQLEHLEEDGIQEQEQEEQEQEGGEDHSEEESDHFNNESEDSEDVYTLETWRPSTTQDVPEFLFARFVKAVKYCQIFYVGSKNRCFVCHMRSNVCSFTRDDGAEFIMPEAADDEELQEKLRKLCDEQDAFKTQKDKEKAERSKTGKKPKAGTKKTIQVNAEAWGKYTEVSEEDNIDIMSQPKRARMFMNPDGSVEKIPSVAESLHGINKALIATVEILGDTRAANEHQAKYLRGIELSMANLQSTMQTHIAQVHSHMVELERQIGIRPVEDEGFVDEEVELVEPEDLEEEVEEVREEVEEVHEEDNEGREAEDDETMKDPEVDEL
ncbi:hypothetical protein M422DRAFT_267465 [Sphaerobolus stellatus SS14]|uniref:Uncharacterized protein n=1 Tax=Sphaerobolus stellatus (strain SS14) TaxID=990650 RepID=A0A0C9U925_SPHS4|nr:hypothetical protein M422DRAFT_267465 [Sphaerobolus stellatus SS14]